MTYALSVLFKSNERPWSTVYHPVRDPEDEQAAIRWAVGMQNGMGPDYVCTLQQKDG